MSDEELRARLRRLRREGPAQREALPDWFRARLDGRAAQACEGSDGGSLGDPERLEVERGVHGETVARRERFDGARLHGKSSLAEVAYAEVSDFALLTGDDAFGGIDLARAVFLDTETTGLSGGAGTSVFLVGLGAFDAPPGEGGGFELWQGFLREPAEERALLERCAARIRASAGVVSFFGKSFDRHRLEDKMRVHGVVPPFGEVPHLDLYYPLRRLYGGAYEDGKLKTLERELCGVEREDDLSGAHAPAAWFDYLAGRPHRLEGVFRHNRDDVLSVVALAAHVGRARVGVRGDGGVLAGDARARVLGVARSLVAAGRCEEAIERLKRALECGLEEGGARELAIVLGEALRRVGRMGEALEVYRGVVDAAADRFGVVALVEMAKLLERWAKDREGARECCRVARGWVEGGVVVGRRVVREIEVREGRLGESR